MMETDLYHAKGRAVTNFAAKLSAPDSDLDFNDHVNNVHYIEWMLERMENVKCKMENDAGKTENDAGGTHFNASESPAELDIVFRQSAKAGEALVSEFCAANGKTLHAIRRPSDGAILATSASR